MNRVVWICLVLVPARKARNGDQLVRKLPILILLGLAPAVYANTLLNGFVVDDDHQVVDNPWVTSPGHLPEIISSGVWEFESRVSSYYRPLMHVLYRVTYVVFGLKPWAFHLVNILLHAAVTALVFLLARRLWGEDSAPTPWFLAPPFLAALIYAVHPIHTESVAWIAGVTDVSFAFFYLLALYLYACAGSGWGLPYALSLVSFLLAMLCKEPAATLPFILLAYEFLFPCGARSWRRIGLRLAPFGVALLAYAGVRAWALGGLAPMTQSAPVGPFAYTLDVLLLFSRYVLMLIFPVSLNFWHIFRPPTSVFSGEVAAAALITGLFSAMVFLMRSYRQVLFASALTVVPLLPAFYVSGLTQGIENAFAERYLYLPSAGFVLLVAATVDWLLRRSPTVAPIVAVGLAALVGSFSIGTVERNIVWRDAYSLWSDAARKSPASAIVRLNHGYALLSRQRLDEGRNEIGEALRLNPGLLDDMLAKGVFYSQKGLTKKAILEFHFILAAKPDFAPAHYNLGVLYESLGRIDQAIREYEATVAIQPDFADAHNNLGIAYAERGLTDKAVAHLEAAVRLSPSNPEFAANLEKARQLP